MDTSFQKCRPRTPATSQGTQELLYPPANLHGAAWPLEPYSNRGLPSLVILYGDSEWVTYSKSDRQEDEARDPRQATHAIDIENCVPVLPSPIPNARFVPPLGANRERHIGSQPSGHAQQNDKFHHRILPASKFAMFHRIRIVSQSDLQLKQKQDLAILSCVCYPKVARPCFIPCIPAKKPPLARGGGGRLSGRPARTPRPPGRPRRPSTRPTPPAAEWRTLSIARRP